MRKVSEHHTIVQLSPFSVMTFIQTNLMSTALSVVTGPFWSVSPSVQNN